MERKFKYRLHPIDNDIVADCEVYLGVNEIQEAASREIAQETNSDIFPVTMLEALLMDSTKNDYFIFKKPLGYDPEIKRGLSALLGRFVARAYITRYFGSSGFYHLGKENPVIVDRRKKLTIEKREGLRPDWVVYNVTTSSILIVEAKGSHKSSPQELKNTLDGAYKQTQSIEIMSGRDKVEVNRIAVATRWGVKDSELKKPLLWVKGSIDKGESLDDDKKDAFLIGMLRHHIANMIEPLGYKKLSDALRKLTVLSEEELKDGIKAAQKELKKATSIPQDIIKDMVGEKLDENMGDLIGTGYFPWPGYFFPELLRIATIVVGVEKNIISAAITGEANEIRTRFSNLEERRGELPYSDYAGSWVIHPFSYRETERE